MLADAQILVRSTSARFSSKPEENQCCRRQSQSRRVSRCRFQRHSVTLMSRRETTINRNGRRLGRGKRFKKAATLSAVDCLANSCTTNPRPSASFFGLRLILCQLISARQTPASFTETHVPPVGSRGKTARWLSV